MKHRRLVSYVKGYLLNKRGENIAERKRATPEPESLSVYFSHYRLQAVAVPAHGDDHDDERDDDHDDDRDDDHDALQMMMAKRLLPTPPLPLHPSYIASCESAKPTPDSP